MSTSAVRVVADVTRTRIVTVEPLATSAIVAEVVQPLLVTVAAAAGLATPPRPGTAVKATRDDDDRQEASAAGGAVDGDGLRSTDTCGRS